MNVCRSLVSFLGVPCAWLLVSIAATAIFPAASSVHAASASVREHGAALFHEKGCEYCHGARGLGGGKGPDLREVRKRRNKEQMIQQITHGGGAMPAFATSLQPSEVDDLVEFLRSKRK